MPGTDAAAASWGTGRTFALIITWAKLTDNRLGFGAHPVVRFDAAWSEMKPSPA